MKRRRMFYPGAVLCAVAMICCLAALPSPTKASTGPASTADHTKFQALKQEFNTAQEVTVVCLSCHNQAGSQVQGTYHWTWQTDQGLHRALAKKNVINNF